ncbi:MAG: hypothetical protein RLZZ385_2184 [Pseudomonadota bacterium]|jgi:hypothetical protein
MLTVADGPFARPACAIILLLELLVLSTPAHAQNDFFGDISTAAGPGSGTAARDWSLLGWVSEKLAYGYESPAPPFSRTDRGLSKVETSLFTQLDWRINADTGFRISGKIYHDAIYGLENDTNWSDEERSEFRNRFEVRDLYLERRFQNGLYVKAGNQILGWGMAEFLRITDVINREDQFTIGQQDLEDLRLQVPALLVSTNRGAWVVDGVLTYDAGFDDMAPAGDEFDQLLPLRGTATVIDRREPGNPWEGFLRASRHYASGDVQFVAGDFNHNSLSLNRIDVSEPLLPVVELAQQRVQMAGMSVNRVDGAWLLFAETGMHFNRPVTPDQIRNVIRLEGWQDANQWLAALGAEYAGFANLTLSAELDSVQILNFTDSAFADNDQLSLGLRFRWTGWNERVTLMGVWNRLTKGQGQVSRLSLEYDWTDNLDLGLMWVDYSADPDSLLYNFRHNDVVQLQLRYSFQR